MDNHGDFGDVGNDVMMHEANRHRGKQARLPRYATSVVGVPCLPTGSTLTAVISQIPENIETSSIPSDHQHNITQCRTDVCYGRLTLPYRHRLRPRVQNTYTSTSVSDHVNGNRRPGMEVEGDLSSKNVEGLFLPPSFRNEEQPGTTSQEASPLS